MPDDTHFFIVGAGRSGTTLLRLILAGHSRLCVAPETWFIRTLVQALPLTDPLSRAQVEQAVAIMLDDYRWPDLEIAPETLRQAAAGLRAPCLADVIDLVYAAFRRRSGKPRCGDKTPVYVEIVPQLAALYPGARFIHLIRDGRDVAISRIDLQWERYYERTRFEWTRAVARRGDYLCTPLATQVLEVKYEALVTEPEATVRRICAFLNEAFEPAMLDWQHLTALVPARERGIHPRLGQTLSRDSVALWRGRLTAFECFAMEACLRRDLEALGYELRFGRPLWRPLLCVAGGLLHAIGPGLARGVRALQRRRLLPRRLYV
jgi:sulfotransferase family protein